MRAANALMPPFWLGDGLPDFGAAVGTFIDEVDLRHAPMWFDVPDIHGQKPYAAGTDDWRLLDVVMLNVGWHVGSPSQAEAR
jgi:hypothetical protein